MKMMLVVGFQVVYKTQAQRAGLGGGSIVGIVPH